MSPITLALTHPLHYDHASKPLSWKTRFSFFLPNNYSEHLQKIASAAASALQSLPRVSPKAACELSHLAPYKSFIKKAQQIKDCPSLQLLEKEITAYRLGISSKAFENNKGFESFAKDARLWQYLAAFDHCLQEGSDGSLQILHKGQFTPWEKVQSIAKKEDVPAIPDCPKLYNPARKYSQNGVEQDSYYSWTELTPFKKEKNHSWGDRYIVELCALASESFRLFGDHSWVRLKTPAGEVYSFGIYREDNEVLTGFSVKKAKIQSPDVSEFWPEKIHTLGFAITEEQFLKIKAKVEKDKADDQLIFDVLNKNCTTYGVEILNLAGIKIPMKGSFLYHLIPHKLYLAASSCLTYCNRSLKKAAHLLLRIVHYPFAVLLNVVFAILGGTKVSCNVRGAKAHLTKIFDLFDPSKVEANSPSLFAYQCKPKIEAARKGSEAYSVPLKYT